MNNSQRLSSVTKGRLIMFSAVLLVAAVLALPAGSFAEGKIDRSWLGRDHIAQADAKLQQLTAPIPE